MLVEEPDVRKALVRFREGRGGNLPGAPLLLDLRLVLAAACCRAHPIDRLQVRFMTVTVNGRTYRLRSRPLVAVCLDGGDREYLTEAAPLMPHLGRILKLGSEGLVRTVIPSFTNPNNMSIITGVTPAVHGICGNYYYDATTDREVPMNDPKDLRAPTILAAFGRAGQAVAAITVKDKLRRLLGKDLRGICLSVEKADAATTTENGIENLRDLAGRANPGVYDPEASAYCFELGIRLLDHRRLDQLYLSTTDYVQHKYPPGSPEANRFYARLDPLIGELDKKGVILGITADHGMNSKVRPDGTPNVRFLESTLARQGIRARVILPITDPYIAHHGALGSFATLYVNARRGSPGRRDPPGGRRSGSCPHPGGRGAPLRAAGGPHRGSRGSGGSHHGARTHRRVARPYRGQDRVTLAWRTPRGEGADDLQPSASPRVCRAAPLGGGSQSRPLRLSLERRRRLMTPPEQRVGYAMGCYRASRIVTAVK